MAYKYLKRLFLILILLLTLSDIYSQTSPGFTAGLNFSKLTGDLDEYDKSKARVGAFGGMTLDIKVAYLTFLQCGLIYSQQGAIYETEYFLYSKKYNYKVLNRIDYLHFPVMWKQHFGDIYTKLGIYGGIAIKADSKWISTTELPDTSLINEGTYKSFTNDFRFYDIGAGLGLGYQSPINDDIDIYFEVGYNLGFFPVDNENYQPSKIMRNRFFTIKLGVIIIGKKQRYATRR